jgi:hypothetical protein
LIRKRGHQPMNMKLCSYIVRVDSGLAPNPFWDSARLLSALRIIKALSLMSETG